MIRFKAFFDTLAGSSCLFMLLCLSTRTDEDLDE